MRQGVERVMSAPLASSAPIKPEKPGSDEKETPGIYNTSGSTIQTPGTDSEDASEGGGRGLICLDVTLPDGQRSDISVEYNTPMLDLLVSLAAKSRLSPSGLSLVLVSEDSGKPTSYTPNQTIGSLEGRLVHIVSKDVGSGKLVNRASKKEKPFEVTQRFTVNLPTGQKTVLRASPLTPVGDLVISACKEKGLELDLDKYVLQLPKKPGIPIDPRATILQTGVQEISLVSRENADRNYAMSMPDLSKLPPSANDPHSFVQLNGQPKKKRGFLSFLGKKDKQFKAEVRRSLVLKSTSNLDVSTPPTSRVTTLPQTVSPEPDQNHQISRPKSMFVSSDTLPLNDKPYEQHPQPVIAPPRKKRRAPEPPVLANSHIPAQQQDLSLKESLEMNKDTKESVSTLQEQTESNGQKDILHTTVVSLSVLSEEILPDINGRHELNLPACESPEADDVNRMKARTNIIVNSSASTENITNDSTMHLASEDVLMKDTLQDNAVLKIDTRVTEPVQNSSSPGVADSSPLHKKNQAPIPPSPVLTSSSPRMETSTSLLPPSIEDSASIAALQTPDVDKNCVHLVQTHSDVSSIFAPHPEIESPIPGNQKELPTSNTSGKQERLIDPEDQNDTPDLSAQSVLVFSENKNEAAAMEFNDILDGVVFDDEPWPLQLALSKRAGVESAQKDSMMMMETASVTSENIDQIDDSLHAGRPCAFIPPPPPSEPPPPEQQPVDFEALTSTTAPIFVDKGTGVNEDNASLATSSAKSSPGQASYGGLNEMGLFIEQMNNVTLENQVDKEEMLLNDIKNKAYTSAPLVTLDSATQSSHLQTDSWDPISEMDLLTGKENHILSNIEVAPFIDESEDFRISNEETNFESEEIMNNLPTLPPPPQFEDNVDISQEDKFLIGENEESAEKEDKHTEKEEEKVEKEDTKSVKEGRIAEKQDTQVKTDDKKAKQEHTKAEKVGNKAEEDDEEYYTEIIEELIIPLGPNGYDFAAARKKTDVELSTEPPKDIVKSSRNAFSTESDFITKKSSIFTSIYQPIPKRERPSVFTTPSKKEQFVLTTEDLSKVTFLPPRSKTEKPFMEYQPFRKSYSSVEDQYSAHTTSKFPVMPNSDHFTARSTTTGKYSSEDIYPSIVQNGITSKSKTQPISVSKDKPTILPKPSYMASSIPTDNVPVFSEDESLYSNDPLLTKSRPHLLMNSHSNPLRRSIDHPRGADYSRNEVYNQSSVPAGAGSDAVADGGEQTNSVPSGYNADTQEQQDVLQRQYLALKSQIQQWQDQLAWNQSLLASQAVGSEHQAERYQQLSDQMALQQEMAMQQLQSTLMALQQQQQQHMPASGQENGEPSAELAARIHQPVAGAAEPTYVAAASPPSIVASPQKQPSDVRSGVNTVKKRPKIERELEPREQLMIAIRTFSKRDLKSVPIEMTRWTPSALS